VIRGIGRTRATIGMIGNISPSCTDYCCSSDRIFGVFAVDACEVLRPVVGGQ